MKQPKGLGRGLDAIFGTGAVGSENYLTLAREFLKRNRKPRK